MALHRTRNRGRPCSISQSAALVNQLTADAAAAFVFGNHQAGNLTILPFRQTVGNDDLDAPGELPALVLRHQNDGLGLCAQHFQAVSNRFFRVRVAQLMQERRDLGRVFGCSGSDRHDGGFLPPWVVVEKKLR